MQRVLSSPSLLWATPLSGFTVVCSFFVLSLHALVIAFIPDLCAMLCVCTPAPAPNFSTTRDLYICLIVNVWLFYLQEASQTWG